MELLFFVAVLLLVLPLSAQVTSTTPETRTLTKATNIAKPGCPSQCGNLTVPYPFGIGLGSGCSLNEDFEINCSSTFKTPKAVIGPIDIIEISDSRMRVSNLVAWRCYNTSGYVTDGVKINMNFNDSFTISQVNTFTVIGCYDYAWFSARNKYGKDVSTGCLAFCSEPEDVPDGICSGSGCCQTPISNDIRYYNTRVRTLQVSDKNTITSTRTFNPCTYAFLGEEGAFKFRGALDFNDSSFVERVQANVPVVLDWAIGNLSCNVAKTRNDFTCQANSKCVDSGRNSSGYRCMCNEGYEGNPYLPPGCQDINECEDNLNHPCYGVCTNMLGSYECTCPTGFYGDPKNKDGCIQTAKSSKFPLTLFSLGLSLGFIAVVLATTGLYCSINKRKLAKQRLMFFEQNGGVLLKQKLTAECGGIDSVKIFTMEELKKATDNYAESRILGRGGQGIVYKGILPDETVVAIKKSVTPDGDEKEQFINEVMILTRVIHSNVVKLLGCCLEDKVPLLVYEFVPNNTLFHHIHKGSGEIPRLSWGNRLRIACESAGALAYLHTAARLPIIHRDVKSSNILLDDNYTVKISDFGASRLVPLDHEEVVTLVQGTLGYLDPEYFHTSELTDKSDVYSFGVVLAELMTGRKPFTGDGSQEERVLATYFVKAMKENRLFQILEPQVVREGTLEQLQRMGELVRSCLKLVREDRPTMKEVVMELEHLRKLTQHPWVNQHENDETSRLVSEVEQSDLYDIPLMTFGNKSDAFSSDYSIQMMLPVNSPR